MIAAALLLAAGLACLPAGAWEWRDGSPASAEAAAMAAARADVVLLGERHAVPAIHAWQADMVGRLAASGRPIVIGLEQLPRAAQPALDRWVAGAVDEAQFLSESDWANRWGHDFAAYRPLFALARARAIPMVALNVDRAFVRRVGREGWDAASQEAPIGRPAAPPAAYVARLRQSFLDHAREPQEEAIARFVEAQTVWDRAMAEGLRDALASRPGAIAVGIMGHGHVESGHGVEHQLRALGVERIWSAVPVPASGSCLPAPGTADARAGTG